MSAKIISCLGTTIALVAGFDPASAQQPDNAAILKAIQGLSRRVDTLQKDVDKLKTGGETAASASSTPPTASPTAPAKAPKKAIAGWHVGAVPGDDESKDAVGGFGGPLSDYKFSLHTKNVHDTNEYSYHGEAVLQIDNPGRYVFELVMRPVSHNYNGSWWFNCDGTAVVNGEVIVKGATDYNFAYGEADKNHDIIRTQAFSGGADLQAGRYPILFKVGCWLANNRHGVNLDTPDLFQAWERNSFQILIKGPDDDAPRPFEANEVFHQIKGRS